jgi:hypothetical protein
MLGVHHVEIALHVASAEEIVVALAPHRLVATTMSATGIGTMIATETGANVVIGTDLAALTTVIER